MNKKILEKQTMFEILQLWMQIKNEVGFDYEEGIGTNKKFKHDFIYFNKK